MEKAIFEETEVPEDNCCNKCGADLIITPDGTVCCPICGLVVGPGYSWFRGTVSTTVGTKEEENDQWDGQIDNIERAIEGDRW